MTHDVPLICDPVPRTRRSTYRFRYPVGLQVLGRGVEYHCGALAWSEAGARELIFEMCERQQVRDVNGQRVNQEWLMLLEPQWPDAGYCAA